MKATFSTQYRRDFPYALISTALILISACSTFNWGLPLSSEVKKVVDGNNAFAADLYQQLKAQQGNLVFSPYSIYTSLAMVYAGARGHTETEMAKTLHVTLPQKNLHDAFGLLNGRMSNIQHRNHVTLTAANSLWCQQGYKFTDAFLSLVHAFYDADANQVDFRDPVQAADKINRWVGQITKGKIKDTVEPEQFTPYTRLILCNAVRFKGEWKTQFMMQDTKLMPFYVNRDQTVTVPVMRQESDFKMARSDDRSVRMLELPYSGNDLSMIIFMPVKPPDLSDLERRLTADNLRAWLAKLDRAGSHKISVYLPRFTTSRSFDVAKRLETLGMTSAFSDGADFSGMDGTTNLFISDVIHKAVIEVNEVGTEAAATTGIHVQALSVSGSFIADHPFIFLIRENHTRDILFLGRVVDPSKE